GVATAFTWMFKRLPLRDWLLFSKKFGVPGIHGETDAPVGSTEWKKFTEAIRAFYNDFAIVTSQGSKITPIEAKASAGNIPQPPLVEWADRGITTLWRGSDLGTMSQKGDSVGSSNQHSETELLEQDDAQWITETLNTQIDRRICELTFGEGTPVFAYVQVRTL